MQSNSNKIECEECQDTGIITKTEWVGDDQSYDIEVKCICRSDKIEKSPGQGDLSKKLTNLLTK